MTEPRTREIQLTAKQLVFVFMSTVLVAVVIFLLGVWVGRGIGVDAPLVAQDTTVVEPGPPKSASQANGPAQANGAPDPPLKYPDTLLGKGGSSPPASAAPSQVPPPPDPSPQPPPQTPPPAAPSSAPKSPPSSPATSPAKPAAADGDLWVVQLGSYSSKANADKQAAEFRAKGYPVSVAPGKNFRVWIGPYPERSAADQVASRLKKEGQESSVIRSR